MMGKIDNENLIKGNIIDKIIYRGKDTFSLLLKNHNNDPVGAINLINCFSLDDTGVIGGIIDVYDVGRLGMKHIAITQKFNLNQEDYESLWLKVKIGESEARELVAAYSTIIVNENMDLYNPISEDKYN